MRAPYGSFATTCKRNKRRGPETGTRERQTDDRVGTVAYTKHAAAEMIDEGKRCISVVGEIGIGHGTLQLHAWRSRYGSKFYLLICVSIG